MPATETKEPLQRPKPMPNAGASPIDQAPKLEPGSEIQTAQIPVEKFKFTLPNRIRKPNDPKTVVIRELTEAEMETADKLGRANASDEKKIARQTGFEAAKMAIVSVDGRPVNHAEGEADAYWGRWSMKAKYLVLEGWRRVNQTLEEDDASFLDSMESV